jgi:hypothetical protein
MHLKPNESPYAIASFRLVIVMQITAEVLALTLVYPTYVMSYMNAHLITRRQAPFVLRNLTIMTITPG